ncbi:MAG TPA: sigma-70 family RNA polymerase sigma factor [Candidatus Acidoferrum sp.]|nr:sigma-70 family RNA polymerase sigma factor [Candidatus Acidoferrum sp.]
MAINFPAPMDVNKPSLTDVIARERSRLRAFIRRRVSNLEEVDDLLQEVWAELVEADRLAEPIEQVGAWLFRVARNRIIDLFRKKREVPLEQGTAAADDETDDHNLELPLPAADAGPEAAYVRSALLETLSQALQELPPEQRAVFIAHELEGKSFKQLAAQSGTGINTLLSWKRRAVLHLRERLQSFYDDLV